MTLKKPEKGYKLVKGLFGKYIEMPEEWEIKPTVNILKITMGQSPPSESYNKGGKGLPFYQGVTDFGITYPNPTIWCTDPKKTANVDSILFSVRAPVGETNLTKKKCCLGRGVAALNPIKCDLSYCYYLVNYNKKNFSVYSQGTTYDAINQDEIANTKLRYTKNIKEQIQIASILSGVDALIDNTEQVIEKTERLKKGLMQKLLSRGISHKKFKKVKVLFGKVVELPETWKIKKLGMFATIQSGEYFAFDEFIEKGIAVLKIDNIMHGKMNWKTKTFVDEKYLKSRKEIVLNLEDIVLALNRPITHNQVKVAQISSKDIPSILYQRVGKISFRNNQINKRFFYIFLNSPLFKKTLSQILIGSDQPYVRTTELLTKFIPFPPLSEQQKIASILSGVDAYIQKNQEYKKKLGILKKGLMQKLLTGQIRV